MKVGLYSITYMGVWYDGPGLSLPEVVKRAAALGFDGIEIGGKRPHGNPGDLSPDERAALKQLCAREGIEIAAVASYNDFSSAIMEHRECQLLMVREQIKLARDVGAPVVRLFFAWPGVTELDGAVTYDTARQLWDLQSRFFPRIQLWNNVKRSLKEVAQYAQDTGVTLALQNHVPLLRHYRDLLDMIREVDSPALKACLDVPILERQDDEYVRQAARETGSLEAHSHFGGQYERGPDGAVRQQQYRFGEPLANYPVFVQAVRDIGYQGYFCFEFCHPALSDRHEPLGIDYIDDQARMALEYLRGLMQQYGVHTGSTVAAAAG